MSLFLLRSPDLHIAINFKPAINGNIEKIYLAKTLWNYRKLELHGPSRALAILAAPQGFASLRSTLIIQIKNT